MEPFGGRFGVHKQGGQLRIVYARVRRKEIAFHGRMNSYCIDILSSAIIYQPQKDQAVPNTLDRALLQNRQLGRTTSLIYISKASLFKYHFPPFRVRQLTKILFRPIGNNNSTRFRDIHKSQTRRISHPGQVHRGSESAITLLPQRFSVMQRSSPMPADCSATQFEFAVVEGRRVVAAFDGGTMRRSRARARSTGSSTAPWARPRAITRSAMTRRRSRAAPRRRRRCSRPAGEPARR